MMRNINNLVKSSVCDINVHDCCKYVCIYVCIVAKVDNYYQKSTFGWTNQQKTKLATALDAYIDEIVDGDINSNAKP